MKNRAVTLLLCLMLAALSILRAFPASAEGITPATAAPIWVPAPWSRPSRACTTMRLMTA